MQCKATITKTFDQFQQTSLEFETNLQGDTYTDLSRSKLFLKVRILKADGNRLDETVKVSPVNLFFHALFKQVDLYFNRTLVSSSGDTYALKAYLKTLFNSTADEKSTLLQGQLFFRDTPGFMGETSPNSGKFDLLILSVCQSCEVAFEITFNGVWAMPSENVSSSIYSQQKLRSACSFAVRSETLLFAYTKYAP